VIAISIAALLLSAGALALCWGAVVCTLAIAGRARADWIAAALDRAAAEQAAAAAETARARAVAASHRAETAPRRRAGTSASTGGKS
jgi:hypothetical protein